MEQYYRRIVDAAGAGDLLVQRAIRRAGHCVFSQDERTSAFDDLVKWVEQGQKPAGEDLTGDLTDAGRAFTTPLLTGRSRRRPHPVLAPAERAPKQLRSAGFSARAVFDYAVTPSAANRGGCHSRIDRGGASPGCA